VIWDIKTTKCLCPKFPILLKLYKFNKQQGSHNMVTSELPYFARVFKFIYNLKIDRLKWHLEEFIWNLFISCVIYII